MNAAKFIRVIGIVAAMLAAAMVSGCGAQPETHSSFATPEEAVTALVSALEQSDQATLGKLLGPGSDEIISSGDPVADKADRDGFVASYREKHELVADGDSKRILQIGAADWPVPVPVVKRDGRWYWDGAEGADEVIYRRVGENELGAIAVALGFYEAQLEYAAEGRDGNPPGVYAQKLLSDPDRQNGLHWPTAEGEPPSPAGPFVATASAEGYRSGAEGQRVPYHGYFYRSLYGQGPSANGGAMNYFSDGLLTGGFALIAWPADYGASGVTTFMINKDGVVFQKDLGEDTAAIVEKIQDFDPDSTWQALIDTPDA